LNPNDIETVTVLKGPEATALYGSLASSGAIVITTRKGKSNKFALQYDNSFRVQIITRFPEVYDKYQPGTNGLAQNVFRYFGPAYEEGTKLYDNIDNFFRTGFSQTHNLGADFGLKGSMFRASASFFDQDGVVPENKFKRLTLRLSNTTKFGKYVEIIPSVTYTTTKNNKVLRSAGGFMLGMFLWPNTDNILNYKSNTGDKIPIFDDVSTNGSYDNPLWNVRYNKNGDETSRLSSSLGVNINPTDWLSIAGRFGYDMYDVEGYLRYHPQSYYISAGTGGLQDNFYRKVRNYNHTITATARKKVGDFSFRLMGGIMWIDNKTQMYAVSGEKIIDSLINGVMYKDGHVLTDDNFDQYVLPASDSSATSPGTRKRLLRNVFGEYNESIVRQFAYFGEAAVSYKNMVFLNYTHRFEAASTLPAINRNYNYPGASLSIILSDIFPGIKKGNIIDYMKLRGSVAQTARLNSPYSTQSTFANNLSSGGGFSYAFTNANPFLGPEKQKTFEMGTELRMFKGRLGLDLTYYNTLNQDQIIENFRLSYGTGFVLNTQNAGSTRNQGVEIVLNASVLKTTSLTWDMTFNFNRMWNKVIKLPANVAEYYIADTWVYANARGGISLNSPTTTITAHGYARNDNGDILINPSTGFPVLDATFKVRGDRNPDFTLGWNNSLRWRSWNLSFLWDLKVGGDVFNGTKMFMTGIGKSSLTADRMEPRIIEGVLNDGLQNTANPTKNTIVVVPYNNYLYYTGTAMPEEAFIEKDVNWLRLRDITLSYTFPQRFSSKIRGMKSLGVFITANDLIMMTNYSGADPGVNGNTAGGRGVGAFGFDYGTLPAPVNLNFGLRASF
jgi:TonB-linked SusC/RagA family outer membrane protein